MSFLSRLGSVTGAVATLTFLASCSGSGTIAPSAGSAVSLTAIRSAPVIANARGPALQSTSVLRPDVEELHLGTSPGASEAGNDDATAAAHVFVSDASVDTVKIFSVSGRLVKTLTGFDVPQGIATDAAANLYVANTRAEQVVVYAKGYTAPHVLSDAGEFPAGVAVSSAGVIAATNIISASGGAGSVSFYAEGKTSPEYIVPGGSFARVYFCAFDKTGNLFVDGSDTGGAVLVGEIAKGTKTIAPLTTSNAIGFPGGIQVDGNGAIVIGDQSGAAVYTYRRSGSTLTLTATTPLEGASDPVGIALTATQKGIWTADAVLAEARAFAFPKGGSPVMSLSGFSQPVGVALTPAAKP